MNKLPLALVLAFLLLTLPLLSFWPPWRYDESWLGSFAVSVQQQGTFSTPLFGDAFGFRERALNRMPLFTLLQAASIQAFGFSLWALRLPSVLCGAAIIALFWVICSRWLGKAWAVCGAALLTFGHLCLMEPVNAPGLASLATDGRYDAAVAAFGALTAWGILKAERRRNYRTSILAGAALGSAILTCPYALAIVPGVALFWLTGGRSDPPGMWPRRAATLGAGALIPAPWVAWVAANWETAWPQLDAFDGSGAPAGLGRLDFASLDFYASNILREPLRYSGLASCRDPGAVLLAILLCVGLWKMSQACLMRGRGGRWLAAPEARLSVCWLLCGGLALAAFDSFKTPG
ncbi:MAG: glycosyltransferase family 39 protein, partial [Acidobacteriota bacterium]